jgi:hypothetical protein
MSAESMAYAGTCPTCGNMTAACVDTDDHKRGTAKFIAQMVRDGLTVERVTCEHVRQTMTMCSCQPNPRKRKAARQVEHPTLPLGAA